MKAHRLPLLLGLSGLALSALIPPALASVERVVLCEEFTNTG
ncbi:MAG TPA: hypothetical protein PK920_06810 [Phycisphaerae bacterium]|jgi:hypothetical protein|nr:hypothetical protein [Phycisphaerae bacterium]HPC22177.1 hypothetical protein [Phycisphaerae bacterium]HRS26953.1 hypothetical protein [Phycisphaerae bacterium]HRT40926.1 hypothetical protein [Phycisphaerae bacterium]